MSTTTTLLALSWATTKEDLLRYAANAMKMDRSAAD